jgi:hypothetical protein
MGSTPQAEVGRAVKLDAASAAFVRMIVSAIEIEGQRMLEKLEAQDAAMHPKLARRGFRLRPRRGF